MALNKLSAALLGAAALAVPARAQDTTPAPPPEVARLRDVESLPRTLAMVLALIGSLVLILALVITAPVALVLAFPAWVGFVLVLAARLSAQAWPSQGRASAQRPANDASYRGDT